MQIILPVKYPPITSFPAIANYLSILWVYRDKVLPWISDRYIQLVIRPYHPITRADFYDQADPGNYIIPENYCPFIGWLRNNQTTAHFNNFSEYIEYQIKQGYYLDACLDNFYMSCSYYFNKHHHIHQTFIYGFNSEKRQVFVSDFYDDGRYTRETVSYNEINKSIEGIDYFINLYKYEDFDYTINLDLLKLSIEDYINSKDSIKNFEYSCASYNRDILYGLNFYKYIIEVFCTEETIDIRPFHILYDHKMMMKIRLDYLLELNIFDNNRLKQIYAINDSLITDSLTLRNMVLKFNFSHNKNLLNKIIEKVVALKKLDHDLFKNLLDCINS